MANFDGGAKASRGEEATIHDCVSPRTVLSALKCILHCKVLTDFVFDIVAGVLLFGAADLCVYAFHVMSSGSVAVIVSCDSLFSDAVQPYHLSFWLSSPPPSGTRTLPPSAEDELIHYNYYGNRCCLISH